MKGRGRLTGRLRRGTGRWAALVPLVMLALPGAGSAHVGHLAVDHGPQAVTTSAAATPAELVTACTGASMPAPDQVITGSFAPSQEGSYVMVPFDVTPGTDAIRVKYCFDQPATPDPQGLNKHTLDLGLYEPDENGNGVPDEPEFRGWGGSSRRDVTVSPEGTIDPDPNPVATQKTTVGYLPGQIPAGQWAAELGVAAVGDELPAEDGVVQWRIEIDLIDDPAFSDEPYQPVPYDPAHADPNPGWYAGDLHVHARHSNPGDATMRETFSYAFCPDPALGANCSPGEAQPGADLDFITLSDYVTTRHWGEIGAFQSDYPGHLIIRSAEVVTYRGHVNNHGSVDFADYRTGPIYERQPDGSLVLLRPQRDASAIFDEIQAAGGWTQINHPETFPSEIPTFGNLCRGCSWEYSNAETDYGSVDAIEVATGPAGLQQDPNPGPNPFTPLAIRFWEQGIDADGVNSHKIAAVGSSDSHNAGRADDPLTQSPIGQATTVVFAEELSEAGIQEGVEAGHTYVKMWGADGPDLRLEATVPGSADSPAIIGDTVRSNAVDFTATVMNLDEANAARPGAYTLHVVRNGLPFLSVPIPPAQDEFELDFPALGAARYRLQVDRTATGAASIEALSSPIYVESPSAGETPPAPGDPGDPGGGGGSGGGGASAGPCEQAQAGTDAGEKLTGGPLADLIAGNGGDDEIRGGRGADCLKGMSGDDLVAGQGGRDEVSGGAGEDELSGGPGRDRVGGGRGDDRVDVRGGGRDRVRCGRGSDQAEAGPRDRLRGCEDVN